MNKNSGWAPYDERAKQDDVTSTDRSSRVVSIGAICDFATGAPELGPSQSFSVREFVGLEDGRTVVINDRGFTLSSARELVELEDGQRVILENVTPARGGLTPDVIRQNTLMVVLPDDDAEALQNAHPWSWLAKQARLQGIEVTAEELKALTYEVILTKRLAGWLRYS